MELPVCFTFTYVSHWMGGEPDISYRCMGLPSWPHVIKPDDMDHRKCMKQAPRFKKKYHENFTSIDGTFAGRSVFGMSQR